MEGSHALFHRLRLIIHANVTNPEFDLDPRANPKYMHVLTKLKYILFPGAWNPKTEYDDEFSIKSLDPAVILCKVLKCRHAMKDRK